MEVTEVNDNSATVRWSPAHGPIKGYRVTGVPISGQGQSFSQVVESGVVFRLIFSVWNLDVNIGKTIIFILLSRPDRVHFFRPAAYHRIRF